MNSVQPQFGQCLALHSQCAMQGIVLLKPVSVTHLLLVALGLPILDGVSHNSQKRGARCTRQGLVGEQGVDLGDHV